MLYNIYVVLHLGIYSFHVHYCTFGSCNFEKESSSHYDIVIFYESLIQLSEHSEQNKKLRKNLQQLSTYHGLLSI